MKFLPGRKHPKAVYPKVEKTVIRIVIKHPEWGCRKISDELLRLGSKLSYVQVNSLLGRIGAETYDRRVNFAKNYSGPGRLLSDIRLEVVNKSFGGESVSKLAKEYSISRDTIYRWIEKYNQGDNLKDNYVTAENHPKAVYPKLAEKVLHIVCQNPNLSVHSIAKSLPISSWTVWNILKQNNLSTVSARMAYASNREESDETKVISQSFGRTKSVFEVFTPNLAPAPPPKFLSLLKFPVIFSITLFFLVYGSLFWFNLISKSTFGGGVGLIFATIALGAGTFFFIYSLKYYITTAILLSFSNKDNKNKIDLKTPGMNADLDGVHISKYPFVSVHIPFYNEKNVVERSIKAATNFDYPCYEVILCDDSTDETTRKIRAFQESCLLTGESLKETAGEGWTLTEVEVRPGVSLKHLHRTTRSGFKGGALDLALKLTDPRTEYISIFDADFVPYPDTLELFVKYFEIQKDKPEVAAVQGYQWHVLNKSENWITKGVRSEYAGSYVIERSAIEIYKGLKQISGSVYMISKDVLTKIGWGTSITEDFELTLRLYNAGYKVLYTPYIQAPAECVSTIERLIRQRMRWAEGHSFNVKSMALSLLTNPKLSFAEKLEFTYLIPYYLQAFFFLVGTISWFLSEAVFRVKLPFWTELWGWSLVITNMVALPLVNAVGMFLEESEKKDFAGIGSFIILSYLIVPFQAYAAVKGFLEKKEGPWFRTPKTGRITDVFKRGKFYRFIQRIIPGTVSSNTPNVLEKNYLESSSANRKFNSFNIKPAVNKFKGNIVLSGALVVFLILSYFGTNIKTGSLADLPVDTRMERTGGEVSFITKAFNLFSPKEVLAATEQVQKVVTNGIKQISVETIVASLMLMLSIAIIALIITYKKRRKHFKKVVKVVLVTTLMTSWLLTSWPPFKLGNFRFPREVPEVNAAALGIVQQTTASSGTSNVTSLTFTLGSTPTVGNLLLLFLNTSDYSTNREPSAPDGTWTQIQIQQNSSAELTVWSKIVATGNGTGYTFTISGTAEKGSGVLYEIQGVDSSNPIHKSSSKTNTNGTSMASPSLTPDILGTMVFAGMTTNDTETCSGVTTGWTLDATVKPSYHATYAAHRNSLTSDTVTAISNTFTTSATTDMPSTAIVMVKPTPGTAALTGTATSSITEADIVAGGKTVILTLTDDTWVATGATFDAQRQNIINGMDSAQSETNGWDAEVKAKISVTDVVRTSDTVVTITLDAEAAYNITATETITVTIPGTAVSKGQAIIASPTFTIDPLSSTFNQSAYRFYQNADSTDVGNPLVSEIADSYSESNYNSWHFMYSGGYVYSGQTFLGDGGVLNSVKFYLKKGGSPTGNAVAKIYTHTGTYGTSGKPTGSALATSGTFDVSNLTTNNQLITFTFSGTNKITLTNDTPYAVALNYSGGDISNYIVIGSDETSSTHDGNAFMGSNETTYFTSANDKVFYVYKDAPDNTSAVSPVQGTAFRLRLLLHIGTAELGQSGQNLKLQIAQRGADNSCDTGFSGESYSDLSDSTGAIRYYNNATPADGANLTANANDPTHSSDTIVNQTYEEANNFTNSVAAIPSGQDGKWDFSIVDNSASQNTTYCLRVVKSDGTALDTYTVIPEFTTVPENPILLFGLFPLVLRLLKKYKKKK